MTINESEENDMAGRMDCFGITDIGKKRPANEDQFLIADLNRSMRVHQTSLGLDHQTRLFGNSQGKLLLVADGMGGHQAGERASQLVVDSVVTYVLNTLQWYFRLDAAGDDDFRDELRAALKHCQTILQRDVEATPQRRGMGTTLTMAYAIWPRMYIVHVGDSRCYLSRGGELKQITRDHTIAQLYKETPGAGAETSDADESSRWSNVLWNVIGADDAGLHPEVYHVNLRLGDALLLCTDGLTKHVSDSRLSELLDSDDSTEAVCQQMVEEANRAGGADNITAVVSRFRDAEEEGGEKQATVDLPSRRDSTNLLSDTAPLAPATIK